MAPSARHSFAFAVVLLTSGWTSEFLAFGLVFFWKRPAQAPKPLVAIMTMETLTQNTYKVVQVNDGKLLSDAVDMVNSGQGDGINLNFVRNFPADINALTQARHLRHLQINDYSWDYDYSAFQKLQGLESLSIYTTDSKPIDFHLFPALKIVAVNWRPKAKSLFDCSGLERLFLGKFNGPDLTDLTSLKNLKYLRLNTGGVKSLNGIESLKNLETLMLMQLTKLEDISSLTQLTSLRSLIIDNCKNVKNIEIIKQLKVVDIQIAGTTPTGDE